MTVDESFMLTLSRFGSGLRILNFSQISPQDRSNAEMYYLSLIGKELSATPVSEEKMRLEAHPRFKELCELYGRPNVLRAVVGGEDGDGGRVIHPRSVAARLVRMAFRLWKSGDGDENSNSKTQGDVQRREIPISLDSYQVKAIVSRIYDLEPYSFKLVWETDEFDPVEKSVQGVTDWDYEDEDEDEDEMREVGSTAPVTSDKSRFVRREVELVESTRDIGFLFQGEVGEVRIRVEVDV